MKSVLLVDDDEVCHFLHRKVLERAGITDIRSARNGQQAISMIMNNTHGPHYPDIIFLDLNMPVMDGFEFLAAFRQLNLHVREEIKIVILTSSQSVQDVMKAKSFGITQFISKPVAEAQLLEVLR